MGHMGVLGMPAVGESTPSLEQAQEQAVDTVLVEKLEEAREPGRFRAIALR